MQEAKTISVSIDRPWQALYQQIWKPEIFPQWASGLSQSSLTRDGDGWTADGPEGKVRIRFSDYNAFGVMDHHVDVGRGPEIYIPLRVIANGAGAEVLLTLFRQPEMTDEKFLQDAEWVTRDLAALRAMVTG
jgi:hypothetical protein